MFNLSPSALNLIPLFPLLGFLINGLAALRSAKTKTPAPIWLPSLVGSLAPFASFLIAIAAFLQVKSAGSLQGTPLFEWVGVGLFSVNFSFLVDPLSSVMILVITGVGFLIHLYSVGYMKEDPALARYFAYLNLFLFFMLLLVLGDNLLVLFVGWEGVGLCSYLLIGFWFSDVEKAQAGKKAFIVNRIGDFAFLIGIFILMAALQRAELGRSLPLLSYSFIADHKDLLAPMAGVVCLCLFIGATGKSAQIPLYVWLPDAMAGPTPVSALIHAATMVTAGIYMVARLFFLFEMAPEILHLIAGIGLATALMAALIAITQYDIKKVLAYSTVSQLGFMFLALGVGAPQAALFHVVTHAFFKACLFLCAGSVIYALHHEQDIRHMGGLFKKMPITAVSFLISTLAIAGIPPFSGFFSKDEILWHTYLHTSPVIYGVALFVAGLTAFYMFRLFTQVFLGQPRFHHFHKPSLIMNGPVFVLALLAAVGGLLGVPEALGGSNHFHEWLHYLSHGAAPEAEGGLELKLMGLSAGWALLLSSVSLALYLKNREWAQGIRKNLAPLYQFVSQKFYIDELYNFVFVRPLLALSHHVLWQFTDKKVVDGLLVHGVSDTALGGGKLVSRLQTGYLGHYLFYFWIGLALFFALLLR